MKFPAPSLLAVCLLLSACRDQPASLAREQPRRTDSLASAPTAPAPPPAPRRVCAITDDEAANDPFGTELTVAEVVGSGGRITGRRPVANAHSPGQTDTLITVQQAGNEFVFYRTPDKDLLSSATLVSFASPHCQKLRQRIGAASRRQGAGCDSVSIRDEMQMNRVLASFRNGQVQRVKVEPYLD
ncbi:hypothetical protein [Hymenobacter sp. B81]|uniref:hypothetical protein n=1 Tax=Hymenobacter sp. B81 TaxID=3344878 RepID=UPI0037DCC6FE